MLRKRYVKVHHNVYSPVGVELTALDRAQAAWLWSRRDAVLVGNSAAAMLGSKWIPADEPAELARSRHPAPKGIIVHSGAIADDEVHELRGIPCSTAARTAYDVGRRIPRDKGIIRVDALLNATQCCIAEVDALAARYPGARGLRQLRSTLDLADGAPNRHRRRCCGCCSCGPVYRGRSRRYPWPTTSAGLYDASTWAGRNGRWASNTTASNTSPTPSTTRTTSSG